MKRWAYGGLAAAVLIIGVFFLFRHTSTDDTVRIAGREYTVTFARTEAEREKGLSGTDALPSGNAMVFVFPNDQKWGIWMKQMNYPIDILWLDSSKKIVDLHKNVQPSSYPKTIFRPAVNAHYVIELAGGTIERTGIISGITVENL